MALSLCAGSSNCCLSICRRATRLLAFRTLIGSRREASGSLYSTWYRVYLPRYLLSAYRLRRLVLHSDRMGHTWRHPIHATVHPCLCTLSPPIPGVSAVPAGALTSRRQKSAIEGIDNLIFVEKSWTANRVISVRCPGGKLVTDARWPVHVYMLWWCIRYPGNSSIVATKLATRGPSLWVQEIRRSPK